MKIAITGATGQLGRLVIEKLKDTIGREGLRALARTPEKAESLGLEVREFDYNKTTGMVEALQGVDRLLLVSATDIGRREQQHQNVIEAAGKAGVRWIVYTSLLHADTSGLSLAGEHLATEKMLRESGIDYTFLRNGWYSENYTGSIAGALANGAFVGSAGKGKISSAARADFAEAAAVVIANTAHIGHTYELAGDHYYTLDDLAAEISTQSGKTIPYKNLPEEEYASILKSIGLPEIFAAGIASWDTAASNGDLFDNGRQLSNLIRRPTTPIKESIREALA